MLYPLPASQTEKWQQGGRDQRAWLTGVGPAELACRPCVSVMATLCPGTLTCSGPWGTGPTPEPPTAPGGETGAADQGAEAQSLSLGRETEGDRKGLPRKGLTFRVLRCTLLAISHCSGLPRPCRRLSCHTCPPGGPALGPPCWVWGVAARRAMQPPLPNHTPEKTPSPGARRRGRLQDRW